MSVIYLDLSDYLVIAATVTALELQTLIDSSRLDLADSALQAPGAAFGGEEFYPDFVQATPWPMNSSKSSASCRRAERPVPHRGRTDQVQIT